MRYGGHKESTSPHVVHLFHPEPSELSPSSPGSGLWEKSRLSTGDTCTGWVVCLVFFYLPQGWIATFLTAEWVLSLHSEDSPCPTAAWIAKAGAVLLEQSFVL